MNNTTSLQDTLQDKKKLNELEQWLNEDKSICKADRDYILDFITKNYIPREDVERLKMDKEVINLFGEQFKESNLLISTRNNAIDEINHSIDEVINLLNKKDE